ncbi:hypothetical protein THAOC_20027 [Thalassiosira oceanica]|uniref:Uncharacterized protein n=1 Tax=Thalassiosira oceanica TaxID=159749 RepID=K0S3F3_THAOC|nr:hypothetical protein THAOC_20027 [Thalassiosira oceanica]|eukprot:EJK59715.1 hypothetical protein THAOC_20027 [Thalassiosira oceanica]
MVSALRRPRHGEMQSGKSNVGSARTEAIVWLRLRSGPVIVTSGAKRCLGEACFVRMRVSEKKRFDRTIRIFRCRSSPEKDLQHRLEVLALATDGEESCPMEGRPFQRMQAQRRPLAAPAPSLPLLLEVEHAKVTERGDLRLRPRMGRAPLSLPSGFRGGFQLQLTRTFARHDRARRPLDRVSEGVLRGRLQATHCGSAQPAVGSTPTRAMDQQRLRAQLYPHLPRTTAVGSTSLTLPTAVVFRVQLRLSNIKAI